MALLAGNPPGAVASAGARRSVVTSGAWSWAVATTATRQSTFPRSKPPLPPRRGIDYDVKGNTQWRHYTVSGITSWPAATVTAAAPENQRRLTSYGAAAVTPEQQVRARSSLLAPPSPAPQATPSPPSHHASSEPIEDCYEVLPPLQLTDASESLGTAVSQQQQIASPSVSTAEGDSGGDDSKADEGNASVSASDNVTAIEDAALKVDAETLVVSEQAEYVQFVDQLHGVTFRMVTFDTPPPATHSKPDSVTDCELPAVRWLTSADGEPLKSTCRSGQQDEKPWEGNCTGGDVLITPTLEEEEKRRSDVARDEKYESEEYIDPVSLAPANLDPRSKAAAKEAAKRQKEEEERRRKEKEKKLKEEEKLKKEEERQKKAKEKEELKEKERREKEEQKREAELQKLLSLYKVSIGDQPVCEATVKKDNLKPEKNELLVRAGERLHILAKDAKGRYLARSSSSRGSIIGIVASSNLSLAETETRGSEYLEKDSDEVYEDLHN